MNVSMYSQVWNLDVFFKGGSASEQFALHMGELWKGLEQFQRLIENWTILQTNADTEYFITIIDSFQRFIKKMREAGAFVSCLQAQNTQDKKAVELKAHVTELSATFQTALTLLDVKLTTINTEQWEQLINDERLNELAFVLRERRERATEMLSMEEESLIHALSIDGYHGWGQMYDVIVSTMKVSVKKNGEEKLLSVGQAANLLAHPIRQIRQEMFKNTQKAWEDKADYLANTLNHLAGFRLNVYKKRGWNEVLREPLNYNRMKKETLETMWAVISKNKQPFVQFLQRKAKLLGVDKLSWYDVDAPLGKTSSKMCYQEGAQFIMEQFSQFGEDLTAFAKMAFENDWIEAEDRPNKAPGGFHTYFPESSQSRIFMTYSGTPSNVSTLAHELGHGFHTYAMRDLPILNRNYAMNVAETASTFAEMIVADAAVRNAKNKEEKIVLLEDKIQRSVSFFMNIHARFLFETRFYEERKQGMVSAERLNELMVTAQQEAYCDSLEEYDPLLWASKLHFYITGVPFYNFPYTFGYLFSLAIYVKAVEEGKSYEKDYMSLLKDSASMTVEDLALKHLNVDLTKRDFWEKAVKVCIHDVEEFLQLTE